MSSRYNPFTEIERFFDQMSRQFEEVSGSLEAGEGVDRWTATLESMAIDVVEQDERFVVTADLPGFEHDDVELRITDTQLHIEAQHSEHVEEEEGRHIRRERRHRSLSRSVELPLAVDVENVEASMKHGVLTITLPKQEVGKAHHIEIESN